MAPTLSNQQVLLKSRPDGFPDEDNFELVKTDIDSRPQGPQDVLVQLLDLSVDPYLRGRMNAGKSYVPGFELGKVSSFICQHLNCCSLNTTQYAHSDALVAGHACSLCIYVDCRFSSVPDAVGLIAAPEQWRHRQSGCIQQQQFQGGRHCLRHDGLGKLHCCS